MKQYKVWNQCFKPFLYPIIRSFLRGQKVLKSEFPVEAIIIFVKSIKKASSGIFTLYKSQ